MIYQVPVIQRKSEVLIKFGLPRSTFHSRIKAGLMPPPISLGARAVGWLSTEIDLVLAAMIAGQDQGQIKQLVTALVAKRKNSLGVNHG
jgi:prophage regulatory protein